MHGTSMPSSSVQSAPRGTTHAAPSSCSDRNGLQAVVSTDSEHSAPFKHDAVASPICVHADTLSAVSTWLHAARECHGARLMVRCGGMRVCDCSSSAIDTQSFRVSSRAQARVLAVVGAVQVAPSVHTDCSHTLADVGAAHAACCRLLGRRCKHMESECQGDGSDCSKQHRPQPTVVVFDRHAMHPVVSTDSKHSAPCKHGAVAS